MLKDRLTPMVVRILAREGQTVTLTQPSRQEQTAYTPSTGELTESATTTCNVKAVVLDFGLVSNGLQSKSGSIVSLDDKECYLSPVDVNGNAFPKTLQPNDKLTINGNVWNIETIKEYNPSSTGNIMYKLLIKR